MSYIDSLLPIFNDIWQATVNLLAVKNGI